MVKTLLALACVMPAAPVTAQTSLEQLYQAAPAVEPAAPPPAYAVPGVQGRWPTASHAYFDTALILGIKNDDPSNDFYPFAGEVKVAPPSTDGSQQQEEVLGLKGGMASEAAHPSYFANGGDTRRQWDLALKSYRELDFVRAYYYIGQVAHLTQDQAVPVHVANINHVITFGDKFEKAIKKNLNLFAKLQGKVQALMLPDMEPYAYYQPLQDDTRAHLPQWVNPDTKIPYWPGSPDAPAMGSDVTKGPWSHYPAAGDTYDLAKSPEIMDRQMLQAAVYTSGVLRSAAKRLPPVAGSLSALKETDAKLAPVDLSLWVYDNRRGEVEVSVSRPLYGYVSKGTVKTSTDGNTVPSATFRLRLPPPAAWQKGDDTVTVTLRDADGNVSQSSVKVRYDAPFEPGNY